MHSTASAYKTDHICHSQLQQPYTIAYTIHSITAKKKTKKNYTVKITPEWLLQFHVSLNCMMSTIHCKNKIGCFNHRMVTLRGGRTRSRAAIIADVAFISLWRFA